MLKRETLGTILIIIFTVVTLFGLGLSMPVNLQGQMTGCALLENHNSICQMYPLEHVTAWQSKFLTTQNQDNILVLVALLAVGAALLSVGLLKFNFSIYQVYRLYQKDHPDSSLFSYLTLVFSRGILQPKLYA